MNKQQKTKVVSVNQAISVNHNESVLKVRKKLTTNHNQTVLKAQ